VCGARQHHRREPSGQPGWGHLPRSGGQVVAGERVQQDARQDRTLDARPLVVHETADKGHGRLETRRVSCTDDIEWMGERGRWKGLQSIVMVERERTVGNKTSRETAYYLTSRGPDAEILGRLIRRHWAVESELHWVLDMVFDEDRSRIRDRNAATNLALLRKLSLTLLEREQSDPRKSIVMKRRRVGWDNDYPFTVLAAAAPPSQSRSTPDRPASARTRLRNPSRQPGRSLSPRLARRLAATRTYAPLPRRQ
jgi:predicted transposase YbfD/YdcC